MEAEGGSTGGAEETSERGRAAGASAGVRATADEGTAAGVSIASTSIAAISIVGGSAGGPPSMEAEGGSTDGCTRLVPRATGAVAGRAAASIEHDAREASSTSKPTSSRQKALSDTSTEASILCACVCEYAQASET